MNSQAAFAYLKIRDNGGLRVPFGYLRGRNNQEPQDVTPFAPMNNQGAFPHLRIRNNGGDGSPFGYLKEQDNIEYEANLQQIPANTYGIHGSLFTKTIEADEVAAQAIMGQRISDGSIDSEKLAAHSVKVQSIKPQNLFHRLFPTPMEKVVGGLVITLIVLGVAIAVGWAGWLWWLVTSVG